MDLGCEPFLSASAAVTAALKRRREALVRYRRAVGGERDRCRRRAARQCHRCRSKSRRRSRTKVAVATGQGVEVGIGDGCFANRPRKRGVVRPIASCRCVRDRGRSRSRS